MKTKKFVLPESEMPTAWYNIVADMPNKPMPCLDPKTKQPVTFESMSRIFGEELVRQAYAAGVTVTSLPGPAACITALTLSGLPTRRFAFEAFLPTDKKERAAVMEDLRTESRTIILYEAPHRLIKTLAELSEVLGDRPVSVCKELTKKHETVYRSTLKEAVHYYESNEPRGEYVLVIEGKSFAEQREEAMAESREIPLTEHMQRYLDQGMDRKEAMKAVAADRGIPKREVYRMLLEEE